MKLIDILKRFLTGSGTKALMDINTNVNSNKTNSNAIGTGQTGTIKSQGPVQIDNSTNYNITINLPANGIVPEDAKQLLREQFNQKNIKFIYQPSNNEIENYNAFEKESDQTGIIEYFKNKISQEDIQCLKTGLYIRELTKNDKTHAVQIRDRASTRGKRVRNIINIASAGYFETYIKPIFDNKPFETAKREYEEIVEFLPEFIFVHNNMSVQNIISEVCKKIQQKEKYHLQVKRIIISGLGSTVATIKKSHPKLASAYPDYTMSFDMTESSNLKQARLIINLIEHIN